MNDFAPTVKVRMYTYVISYTLLLYRYWYLSVGLFMWKAFSKIVLN